MFAFLPIVGGLLLGWRASRTVAIIGQLVCYAIAVTVLTVTAPSHGGDHADGILIGLGLAVVSAASLLAGFWFAGRRTDPSPR